MRLLLLAFILIMGISQTFAKEIQGTIIDNQGDSIQAILEIPYNHNTYFRDPNFFSLQKKVKIRLPNGQIKILWPGDVREISFYHGGHTIRMVSRKNNLKTNRMGAPKQMFLRLIQDGPVKLFRYYSPLEASVQYYGPSIISDQNLDNEEFLLQKGDMDFFQPSEKVFKRDILMYLQDCPDFVNSLLAQDLTIEQLESIITDYNQACAIENQ